MNRYKLTPFAKGFLSIIVLIVIAGITYMGKIKSGIYS